MRTAIILAMLLACSFAMADGQYWTVVYDEAPAAEVVTAANFAASMKGSVSTTFTGKTFSQAQEDLSSFDDGLIVIFDGRDATIMYDDSEHGLVASVAEDYLTDQGLDVDIESVDYELFRPEVEDEVVLEEEPPEEPEPVDSVVDDLQKVVVLAEHDEPEPPKAEPEPEKPNVLVRVWRWFSGIFS